MEISNNDYKLTASQRIILSAIRRRYFYFKKAGKLAVDGSYYYDDARAVEEDGVSRCTLSRGRVRLKAFGLIDFHPGIGRGYATKYWLTEIGIKMRTFKKAEYVSNLQEKGLNLRIERYQNETPNVESNLDINKPEITQEEVDSLRSLQDDNWVKSHLSMRGYSEQQINKVWRALSS